MQAGVAGLAPVIRRLWDRPGVEVLRRAVRRVARLRHRLVGAPRPAGRAARPARGRHRHRSIGAVERGDPLGGPLTFVGIVFVAFQVLSPLHQAVSANLGSRTAALAERPADAWRAPRPRASRHLERGELINDLTDGPRLRPRASPARRSRSRMDFIAGGLVEMVGRPRRRRSCCSASRGGRRSCSLAAWGSTHWLLRESGVWRDRNTDEVRTAQRHADYAYRLAVDPPAAKEVRLFGLADWVIERFARHRRRLYELQWQATRLRERSVLACLADRARRPTLVVFWALGDAADRRAARPRPTASVYLQTAVGVERDRVRRAQLGARRRAAPVAAVLRLEAAMAEAGALADAATRRPTGLPAARDPLPRRHLRLPGDRPRRCSTGFDLTIPAGTSIAIVGQNGAGKTTLAKLLCRLYDPQAGAIEVDGVDLRELDLEAWRTGVAAVFQDFVRYELSLRDNVAPGAARAPIDAEVERRAAPTPARTSLAGLDIDPVPRPTTAASTSPAGSGSGSRSPGRWPRCGSGAGVVLLDEPTAQLDVRGEAEIFERVLAATRALHDDPRLPPVLDRAAGRPHLRGRARPGGRARQPRRADGARRPLPHDVRPAGVALRRDRRAGRGGGA